MESRRPSQTRAAPNKVRVLIADDSETVRSALSVCLYAMADLEWVGEAASGEAAVRLSEDLQPDVVLMDLVMPGMNGIEATRIIRERCPHIKIIGLTSYVEGRLISGVLDAGACAVLFKKISAMELAESIEAIHAGRPLPPKPDADKGRHPAHPST